MSAYPLHYTPHAPTVAFWEALSSEARHALCDAAVLQTGWYREALDMNGGEALDRRTLGRLIDSALEMGE